jgi:quinol monooxygenase YgiN
MSEIQVTARLKIHDGKLEEFKRIAKKCMQSVRTKDSGTLQYDWFFSGDQSECVVHERYRDSNAVLEHNANLGETLRELFEMCSGSGEVFGSPSPDLVEGLKRIGARSTHHTSPSSQPD